MNHIVSTSFVTVAKKKDKKARRPQRMLETFSCHLLVLQRVFSAPLGASCTVVLRGKIN